MRAGFELHGRYRLDARLGRGGMGEVWRGHDLALERPVAVKIMLGVRPDDQAVARFRREATIAARLRHPGITAVHDIGQDGDLLFMIMELLEGGDLAAVLAAVPGGLPVPRAASLTHRALEALAAAHAGGVVHRDLKPANLFLTAAGEVKICDFGIARAADATSVLTAKGQVFGTPAYMSPEQCRGEPADERSDLYSMGCVLHALLTGRPPFPPGPPLEVMIRHREHLPEGPRTLRPDVPPELDRLVLDLLAKDPADRPAGAARLAADLAAFAGPSAASGGPRDTAPPVRGRTLELDGEAIGSAVERLLDEAARLATSDDSPGPDPDTLNLVGAALLDTDPLRAGDLLEWAARAVLDRPIRGRDMSSPSDDQLGRIAGTTARLDARRAERVARSIAAERLRAETLAGIAAALVPLDAPHAAGLLEEAAVFIDGSPRTEQWELRHRILVPVAQALHSAPEGERAFLGALDTDRRRLEMRRALAVEAAPDDPDEALQLASAVADVVRRAQMLTDIAERVAGSHPGRSEQIARILLLAGGKSHRLTTYCSTLSLQLVVERVAATDPDHACQIIGTLHQHDLKFFSWKLITDLAPAIPARVEQLLAVEHSPPRDFRLPGRVASAMALNHPERAERLVKRTHRSARRIVRSFKRRDSLGKFAGAIAPAFPDRAEAIARSIERPFPGALSEVAVGMREAYPERAARLADGLAEPSRRDYALSWIAPELARQAPDRAERLASTITGRSLHATTLARIAQILDGREPEPHLHQDREGSGWDKANSPRRTLLPFLLEGLPDESPDE
ncbi:hypothetical protein GCM10010191_16470 [Actinomadura vinacea]|uniref:non-specific serine/threonine protein kinase n=1 Tax=Actinomadura vinacea TaxID=115336 RepID=A0ABN3INS9_9ACTN